MLTKQNPFIGHYCVAGFHVNSSRINFTRYKGIAFYLKATDPTKEFYVHFWEEGNIEDFEYCFRIKSSGWIEIHIPYENFESPSCARDKNLHMDREKSGLIK